MPDNGDNGGELEAALAQLAQTMGVSIPTQSVKNTNSTINNINSTNHSSHITHKTEEPEEGEIKEDGEITHSPKSSKKTKRKAKKNSFTAGSKPVHDPAFNAETALQNNNNNIKGQAQHQAKRQKKSKHIIPQAKRNQENKQFQRFTNNKNPPSKVDEWNAEVAMRRSSPIPPTNSNEPTKVKTNTVKNKFVPRVPCKYWMEGKCAKGQECTFSHTATPNKTAEEAKSEQTCKYHMVGSCLKGDACLFSHDLSKVPCKYFHVKGECAAGKCKFSHAPINDEERHLLFAESTGSRDPRLSASIPDTQSQLTVAPFVPAEKLKISYLLPAKIPKLPLNLPDPLKSPFLQIGDHHQ